MAVEPAGDDPVSAILAGSYGGNLVLRELTVGSSLFLPGSQARRASMGRATSTPFRATGWSTRPPSRRPPRTSRSATTSTSSVGLAAPLAETPTHWIGIGFGDSLDDALVACLRELIAWLHAASGISEGEAYALCSMAVSFRVTQYAHQTGSAYTSIPPKAVHGLVPKSVFPAELARRIASWLRPVREQLPVTLSAEDRLDILELLARADNAATRRDAAAYVALFTDDAVLDGEKGEHRGRQALAEAVGPIWASRRPRQHPSHPQRRDRSGTAAARSRPRPPPSCSSSAPGPPPAMRSVSTIVQQVIKTGPTWRIARRTVTSP